MRKYAKKIIVFSLIALFVISGMCSKHFIHYFKDDLLSFVKTDTSFSEFTANVNSHSAEKTLYHGRIIDFNSFIMRLSGKSVVEKDDSTVIRLDNGYLYGSFSKTSNSSIKEYADSVNELYKTATQNSANFLFVMEPAKGMEKQLPLCIDNYYAKSCDNFIYQLNKQNIPTLNLVDKMKEDKISEETMFFATDHHWKPESGFWATGKILADLNNRYSFEYNKNITDFNNYNIKVYKDWFLGSQGKKVGRYFTKLGADDISLITPKFDTHLIEEQPNKNEVRDGDFTNSVLFMENIDTKDYYNLNPYAVYSGGDFRLQIIKNELSDNNNKILIVRDSYSCATVPFLSLAAKEVHVVDVRYGDWYVGDKINVHEYIEEIKPNYVIVAYNIGAICEDSDCFNF